jgi:hypothetical protein
MDFPSAADGRFAWIPPLAGATAEQTFPLAETGAEVAAGAIAGAVA